MQNKYTHKINYQLFYKGIYVASFLGNVVHVVELSVEVGFTPDCLLHDLLEFVDVFAHEGCCVSIEGVLEVGCLDVFHEVE